MLGAGAVAPRPLGSVGEVLRLVQERRDRQIADLVVPLGGLVEMLHVTDETVIGLDSHPKVRFAPRDHDLVNRDLRGLFVDALEAHEEEELRSTTDAEVVDRDAVHPRPVFSPGLHAVEIVRCRIESASTDEIVTVAVHRGHDLEHEKSAVVGDELVVLVGNRHVAVPSEPGVELPDALRAGMSGTSRPLESRVRSENGFELSPVLRRAHHSDSGLEVSPIVNLHLGVHKLPPSSGISRGMFTSRWPKVSTIWI